MRCITCKTDNRPGSKTCVSCGVLLNSTPTLNNGASQTIILPRGVGLQNGAYKIASVLGQGGFGITYKGGDMGLKRYVAIKEFFPQGCLRNTLLVQPTSGMTQSDYRSARAKFLEEARTLARFNHPGIVRVFTTFEENNTAYMVMELLEGCSLQSVLNKKGVLSEKEAIDYIENVAEALTVVHAANVIHRDIKPDNIIITDSGRAVLIDFGTARAFASNKTVRQTAMLTPGYAPLEQYGQEARFGVPCDVYALAATFYHCVTGQLPPPATDRATGVDLQAPDRVNPNLSPNLSRALMWAMEMKADARPQSMQAFIGALRGAAPSASPQLSTPPAPPNKAPSSLPQTPEGWFYNFTGVTHGPVDQSAIPGLIRIGHIERDTMVWREGMPDWAQAKLTDIGNLFQGRGRPPIPLSNGSGQGGASSPLPAELKGFSWAAFLLGWIWGVSHGVPWTLFLLVISFIPFLNLAWLPLAVALGFAGNELAWKNRKWDSIEQFKTVQGIWVLWGLGIFAVSFFIGIISLSL